MCWSCSTQIGTCINSTKLRGSVRWRPGWLECICQAGISHLSSAGDALAALHIGRHGFALARPQGASIAARGRVAAFPIGQHWPHQKILLLLLQPCLQERLHTLSMLTLGSALASVETSAADPSSYGLLTEDFPIGNTATGSSFTSSFCSACSNA